MQKAVFCIIVLIVFFAGTAIIPVQGHETDDPVNPIDIGQPAPNFELTDQDGGSFSLESVRGKVILLTFIYTRCPDICSSITTNMKQIQDLLGNRFGEEVIFVSISFDPSDTPQTLKEYAGDHDADYPGWKFLTTQNEDEMKHIAESYSVFYNREDDNLHLYSHSAFSYLIDQDLIVKKLYIVEVNTKDVVKDISELTSPSINMSMYLLIGSIVGISVLGAIFYSKLKKTT